MFNSNFMDYFLVNEIVKKKLKKNVDLINVRLQLKVENGYE
jgi:hypothetical protein